MKERLDHILWKYGYADSIEKATRLIMLGLVIVNEKKIDKPGTPIAYDDNTKIKIKGENLPYVSRGGLKLKRAVDVFSYSLEGKRVLDIGASTGGFTDCALQEGANFVYALDVGSNQLAWKLRKHAQVRSMEQCHIRDLRWEHLDGESVDAMVMDVSFISVCGIFSLLLPFLKDEGRLLVLIKPQFEVEKKYLEKGIVKNLQAHELVLKKVKRAAEQAGFFLKGIEVSPILGGKGNVEYLSFFGKEKPEKEILEEEVLERARVLGGLK